MFSLAMGFSMPWSLRFAQDDKPDLSIRSSTVVDEMLTCSEWLHRLGAAIDEWQTGPHRAGRIHPCLSLLKP